MYLKENQDGIVVVLNTEMARHNTRLTTQRIHQLCGWDASRNNSQLFVLNLRELSTEQRTDVLPKVMEKWKPALVFVDGIRDMVTDINSPKESSEIINLLMRLSSRYGCHICSVLHENKNGGQLRGHLGSELSNKSETVMDVSLSASGNISTVKPRHTRNMPFDAFSFRIDENELPKLAEAETTDSKRDKLTTLFAEILPAGTRLGNADLKRKILKKEEMGDRTADSRIKEAVKANIIIKGKGRFGLYSSAVNHAAIQDGDEDV
ncbi:hypothetical protein Barb7_00959 [Bacteroidales bacterium Barb7]|nr:hypothetical protein Barb7_00959 [Bacteroidales bacterium Barb7]